MTYRKIIGFGGSSFVVSLPKEWINKYGLKKGDVVNIEEESDMLRILPKDFKTKKNESFITIKFQNINTLKSQLIYSYLGNYNTINIVGDSLINNLSQIRETVQGLVALEIIQQTSDKIILKDFLNIYDINVYDIIRRIDRIILSMAEESLIMLKVEGDYLESIEQKEIDINRLSNLVFKVLKRCFNPVDKKILGLTLDEVFYYWELVLFMEKFADQVKRLPRHFKTLNKDQSIIEIYNELIDNYKLMMKAHFTKDIELVTESISKKPIMFKKCDEAADRLSKIYIPTLEKLRLMNTHIGDMGKVLLKLNYQAGVESTNK